jgi:hypothetical protein
VVRHRTCEGACANSGSDAEEDVKEQMGHSSIQVTVDTHGHLIPGADVSFVGRLDANEKKREKNDE